MIERYFINDTPSPTPLNPLNQESPPSPDAPEESTTAMDCPPVEEPRVLGLAMVPGHHIVSIHVDDPIPDSGEEDEGGAIL